MEKPPLDGLISQPTFPRCHQCNCTQKREEAKFCFYCGAILSIVCKNCHEHNTYGTSNCCKCNHVLLSILDVASWQLPDKEEDAPVLLGHTVINGVTINLFWSKDTFPRRRRKERRRRVRSSDRDKAIKDSDMLSDKTPDKAIEKSPSDKLMDKSPSTKSIGKSPSEKLMGKSPSDKFMGRSPSNKSIGKSPSEKVVAKSPSEKFMGKSPSNKSIGKSPSEKVVDKSPRAEKLVGKTENPVGKPIETVDKAPKSDKPAKPAKAPKTVKKSTKKPTRKTVGTATKGDDIVIASPRDKGTAVTFPSSKQLEDDFSPRSAIVKTDTLDSASAPSDIGLVKNITERVDDVLTDRGESTLDNPTPSEAVPIITVTEEYDKMATFVVDEIPAIDELELGEKENEVEEENVEVEDTAEMHIVDDTEDPETVIDTVESTADDTTADFTHDSTLDRSEIDYTESSETSDTTQSTEDLFSDHEDDFAVEEGSGLSQREHVINEILNTENDYLKDLDVIIEVYKAGLEELHAHGPQSHGKVLSAADIDIIFGNVNLIRDANFQLFRYMQGGDDCPDVPHAFLLKADSLDVYALYCSGLEKAIDYITQLQKTKPIVSTFLMNCRNRPECKRLDINSWLIKPLQRLCKYPLLLRELIKATPEDNQLDLSVLQDAMKKVEDVVARVNNYKKDVEFKKKVAELATMYDGAEALKLGTVAGRYFVQDGRVQFLPKGKGRYHLFTDIILLSKKHKIIDNIPLHSVIVKEKTKIEKGVNKTSVDIMHIGVKVWNIFIESEAERIMFVRNIMEFVDKSMENLYNTKKDNNMGFSKWREARESVLVPVQPLPRRLSFVSIFNR